MITMCIQVRDSTYVRHVVLSVKSIRDFLNNGLPAKTVNSDTLPCRHMTASSDDTWYVIVEMGDEGEGEVVLALSFSLACCSVMYDSADDRIEAGDSADTDTDADCDCASVSST